MILLEGNANIGSGERSFINFLKCDDFPWYYLKATDNFYQMMHIMMSPSTEPQRGEINSPHARAAEDLFLRICGDYGVLVRTVYRIGVNLTFADPSPHGDIHIDHMFPHKNFILYLNKFDKGNTLLFDKDCNLQQTIYAAEDKFAIFDGDFHAQEFCAPQQSRGVLVVTFDGDVNGG